MYDNLDELAQSCQAESDFLTTLSSAIPDLQN